MDLFKKIVILQKYIIHYLITVRKKVASFFFEDEKTGILDDSLHDQHQRKKR